MLEQHRSCTLDPRPWNQGLRLQCEQDNGAIQFGVFSPDSGPLHVSLGYRRVLDSDANNAPGQDYAVVVSDRDYVVGVVADGVAQSFYGNIAAKYIGTWLADFLWKVRNSPPDEGRLSTLLREQQAACAESDLRNISLDHLPEMLRRALELTRASGSQAVFVAYVWDLARQQLVLYHVGDAIAIVHQSDRDPEVVDGNRKGRWSTAGKSDLYLTRTNFGPDVTCIVIKSDGPSLSWGQIEPGKQVADHTSFERMASERSAKDDVSFVASWLGDMPQTSHAKQAYRPINIEPTSTFETTAKQPAPTHGVEQTLPVSAGQTPYAAQQSFANRSPSARLQPPILPTENLDPSLQDRVRVPFAPENFPRGGIDARSPGKAAAGRNPFGLALLFVVLVCTAGFTGWWIGSNPRQPIPDKTAPGQRYDAATEQNADARMRVIDFREVTNPGQDPNAKRLLDTAEDKDDVVVHLKLDHASCCNVSVTQNLKGLYRVAQGDWYLLVDRVPAGEKTPLTVSISSRTGIEIRETLTLAPSSTAAEAAVNGLGNVPPKTPVTGKRDILTKPSKHPVVVKQPVGHAPTANQDPRKSPVALPKAHAGKKAAMYASPTTSPQPHPSTNSNSSQPKNPTTSASPTTPASLSTPVPSATPAHLTAPAPAPDPTNARPNPTPASPPSHY